MDLLSEEFEKMDDGDPQMMTMLTRDRVFGEDPGGGDEVEDLQQSLREAVHDEAVQPKMQCLMMDPSFSMVTVQGEDSGIEWETAPSRCTTPWGETTASRCTTPWGASDAVPEFGGGTPVPTSRPSTPGGSGPPAGRIIFVMMDDDMLLKRKKSKGSSSGRRSRGAEKPKAPPLLEVLDGVSGRPELAEVSLPNVKAEGGGGEGDEAAGPSEDEEQRLFRVVSDGSEILNIVVPHKLADSVDEEESGAMADNLSYLEETVVVKRKEVNDDVMEPSSDEVAAVSTQAPAGSGPGGGQRGQGGSHGLNRMDPPGAPVARGEDYFEQFTRIDAHQAPGGPAVVKAGQEEEEQTEEEEDGEIQESAEPGGQPRRRSTAVAVPADVEGTTEAAGGEEFDCQLLDEVFYGGMDDQHSGDEEEESKVDEYVRLKSPLKKSGSALFGSQEDILTPIFLPEAPAKIIDLILLEEPKAMPFLYTDLYEEAMGSTETRDDDAESMTSEKSFHSRQSDREDRGYLEKYCLKDETPVAAPAEEVEPAEEEEEHEEGGIRILSQDAAYSDFRPSPEEEGDDVPAAGEEITDFFRSSANSSPCDGETFPPVLEETDVSQSNKKGKKAKEKKLAAKTAVPQTQVQPGKTTEKESVPETAAPLGLSSSKPASAPSGGDSKKALSEKKVQIQPLPQTNEGMPKPVAPPRRKSASAVKISLDLAPLTAVEGEEECGVKEQREEEKEKASPAETADEGEGEGDEKEAGQASSVVVLTEDVPGLTTETDTKPGGDTSLLKTEVQPEKGGDRGNDSAGRVDALASVTALTKAEMGASNSPPTSVTEPAKESGRCIIL